MKLFGASFAVLILSQLLIVDALVSFERAHSKRPKNGCYGEKIGFMKNGEMVPIKDACLQALCHGPSGVIIYITCSIFSFGYTPFSNEGCKMKQSLNKPFPHCCPRFMCPKSI